MNIQRECKEHGLTTFIAILSSHKTYQYRCRKCRSAYVTRWRRRMKAKLVEEFGGECKLCTYKKCQQALQFHHHDPETKKFSIAQFGNARAYEKMREEARKCVLLCGNCHAEVEAGITKIPLDLASNKN